LTFDCQKRQAFDEALDFTLYTPLTMIDFIGLTISLIIDVK
jgi:hypothetical protein